MDNGAKLRDWGKEIGDRVTNQGARSPGCWKVPNPDLALTRVNAMVARIENPDSGAIARLASGDEGKVT